MRDHPPLERTLGSVLEEQAALQGDRTFLTFRGELSVSFREFDRMACTYGNGFLRAGIGRGAKVAVMMSNCPEYLYSWFGLAKVGAVMVPVNTAHRGDLLAYILEASDAGAVIVDSELLTRILEIADRLPKATRIFVRGGKGEPGAGELETLPLASISEGGADPISVEVRHSDPMTILFTSGTTGPSKGVVMSHHYYYHAARVIGGGMEVTGEDVLYTCLPLFHVNAQVCTVLAALLFDARVAMFEHFSARSFWSEIRESGATMFLALGAMGNILYKSPPQPDDAGNAVRLALVAPPPEDVEGFERRFGLRVVYETFGLTEGIVTPPGIAEPRRPGCCGRPGVAMEVRIVDDDDNEVERGRTGEIVIRPREPYTMMSGYYNMPEATLDAFRNLWFHTGDLGHMDADGYLYFVGRKKEAIRRRGENISAFEVERIINRHPLILESAAIPVPSELSEDDVKVVVVLKEGARMEPEDLIRFCESRMAYFMVPRYVEFRKSLPKTPTQRVEKYRLKAEGNGPLTWDREKAGYRVSRV